jgi:hypothetical protein
LEQLAAEGLDLFRLVQVRDAEWSDRVRSGEEPYTLESARPIGALYRLWLGPSEVLLAAIGSAGGTHAKPYDELNAACKTARFPAKVNLEGVLRGVGQMQRGEGIPLDEAMNELRRHRRAGGAG